MLVLFHCQTFPHMRKSLASRLGSDFEESSTRSRGFRRVASAPQMPRTDGRAADQLRPISFIPDFAPHATGSVLVAAGNTRVICSAMIEEVVPRWMKEQKVEGGWITAEYSMLPYSTLQRKTRDISRGKLDGRGVEIQRLIGRSLRAAIDLDALGPRTLWVDCDVLQADGGTRTASITGACVAVALACRRLIEAKLIKAMPIRKFVAAVSVGICQGEALIDLNYEEDKEASVDMNLVMTDDGQFVELQGAGEETTFSAEHLAAMLEVGRRGIAELLAAQQAVLASATAS
jgi:ribonuclease PH